MVIKDKQLKAKLDNLCKELDMSQEELIGLFWVVLDEFNPGFVDDIKSIYEKSKVERSNLSDYGLEELTLYMFKFMVDKHVNSIKTSQTYNNERFQNKISSEQDARNQRKERIASAIDEFSKTVDEFISQTFENIEKNASPRTKNKSTKKDNNDTQPDKSKKILN